MDILDVVLFGAKYIVCLLIPYFARVSNAYGGFYAWKRNLYLKTWQDHLNHGPIFRQGPNKLVFNSVKALHDIYLNEYVSKSRCYQAGNVNPKTTNVFNTIDKSVHRIKRKLVGAVVTERSMRTFEPIMLHQINIFVTQLLSDFQDDSSSQDGPGTRVNMSNRCKHLGLDIAGRLAFGYSLNLQTNTENRFLVPIMTAGSWRINLYMQFPSLRKFRYEIFPYILSRIRGKGYLITLTQMIKARLAREKQASHDLYAHMVDAVDAPEGDKITLNEIWSEAIFFMPAAGDTISTTLSALFFYLSRNPRCRKELAHEIRTTFASSDGIKNGAQLASCRYLRACIDEALRMSPPVTGTLWREQLPQDGDAPWVVDGHVIPRDVLVGVNIYSIHHNEEYFPDPFRYNPERWLPSDDTGGAAAAANRAAFVPFSLGARACAGKTMAYLEISLTMAKTLWYFDFEPANRPGTGEKEVNEMGEFLLHDIFTSSHDGPYLSFRPRGNFWKELVAQA
ncbi:hypothetical protein DL769_002135 [Monosporascus sp. CRB-8-3]|nr:hypothetical protein DL769_002135 [Monosporascus sp. CRB-8-3]